jgi:hypothetical protein
MYTMDHPSTRLEVFTAMKIQVTVFWIVTPCSDVIGYRRFGGSFCLHLHSEDRDFDPSVPSDMSIYYIYKWTGFDTKLKFQCMHVHFNFKTKLYLPITYKGILLCCGSMIQWLPVKVGVELCTPVTCICFSNDFFVSLHKYSP